MPDITLKRIKDTTLREGEQAPTVYFNSEEKCVIAEMLYKILGNKGYLEIGFTYNPFYKQTVKDVVKHFKDTGIVKARLLSHCRAVRYDIDQSWSCGVWGIVIFMAMSKNHLLHKFGGLSFKDAINKISEAIRYAKNKVGFEYVEYSLEDATSLPLKDVILISKIAEESEADAIKIADTKGQTSPEAFKTLIKQLKEKVSVDITVHCHNDRGLAVINTIEGLMGGATGIDVSVLGLGERCGIADLAITLENLESLYGVNTGVDFKGIPELYEYVSAASGIQIPPQHPVVGAFARIHKAGTHQKAVLKKHETYETINWSKYGLKSEYELGGMQSDELLNRYNLAKELKSKTVQIIRKTSIEKRRPLTSYEVSKIIERITGFPLSPQPQSYDVIAFIKTKQAFDELEFLKKVRMKFTEHKIPIKIRKISGYCDFIVEANHVRNLQVFKDIIFDLAKKGNFEVNLSIVNDEYK
jgi:methanogen homocitrate synthase